MTDHYYRLGVVTGNGKPNFAPAPGCALIVVTIAARTVAGNRNMGRKSYERGIDVGGIRQAMTAATVKV